MFQEDSILKMKLYTTMFFFLSFGINANSQIVPYSGGIGSGYNQAVSAATICAFYYGGIMDGVANNVTPLTICPPFFGGEGDGYSMDTSNCFFVVPIKNIKFYGEKESSRNILHWKTPDWNDVKQFDIEKSSDGISFLKEGTVLGGNNSNFSYLFIDNNPFPDITFYRLKIIEKSNIISYSNIIVLKGFSNDGIKLYPNPSFGLATFEYYSLKPQVINLELIQNDGRVVFTKALNLKPGSNTIHLDLQNVVNGVYILKIIETGEVIKVNIQNR